jgi:nucleotide-binding universal stress UspA family protein
MTIVGYDGTPQARAALAFAVRRAHPRGTVVAVYAVAPARAYLGQPYYGRAVERAQRDGRAILDDLPATSGPVVETALLEGRPAEVLRRLAQLRGAQEIVVGSRGPRRRLRKLRRSVSGNLVAAGDRPVVIVSAPPPA